MKTPLYALLVFFVTIACDAAQDEKPVEATEKTEVVVEVDSIEPQVEVIKDTLLEEQSAVQAADSTKQKTTKPRQDTPKADSRIKRIMNEKIRPQQQDTTKK